LIIFVSEPQKRLWSRDVCGSGSCLTIGFR
jgi:hypothetical protein